MRVNQKVFDERVNLFADLYVRDCPSEFQKEADRLLNMAAETGYSPPSNYNSMTELYKILTVDYWRKYDGIPFNAQGDDWREWYVKKATNPSQLERAIRLLIQKHYFTGIPEEILERRDKAAENIRKSIRR